KSYKHNLGKTVSKILQADKIIPDGLNSWKRYLKQNKMKTDTSTDGAYINEALKSSALNISNAREDEPHVTSDDDQFSNCFTFTNFKDWTRRKAKSAFTKKVLYKRLPILRWLPQYNSTDAVGDLVAGITVGLTVIPQALAYSGIAGLPAAYGLYSSFIGCFIYIFLGSCKDIPMGPTAIASLLAFQTTGGVWQKAVLLSFVAGIIELLMGIFGLGFLVDFVSGPVASGFTSAVALIIVTSQVKDILGISAKGTTFIDIWKAIFKDIENTRAWDTVLGLTCISVLLSMKILSSIKIGPEEDDQKTKLQRFLNKTFWLVGTSRNAILVVVCGVIGYSFKDAAMTPFKLIGDIPPGLPNIQPPPFSMKPDSDESLSDMLSSMGSGLIVVPLIALMESIAICKAFSNGKSVDATQELIAIGVSNVANSFFQGFPITGSLSRGAVNNASGVRTPLGGLYTGLLVILALLFFTPYFAFIPKSTLAAVIIAAVVFMVEVKVIKPMWRSKKTDLVPGLGAFFSCLALPLEMGILVGIGINMAFILYHAARPKIAIETLFTVSGS
ncbi:Sodium-independent sulfate anion transporter, partial [Pseudolycoriella hygida]